MREFQCQNGDKYEYMIMTFIFKKPNKSKLLLNIIKHFINFFYRISCCYKITFNNKSKVQKFIQYIKYQEQMTQFKKVF